MADKYAYIALTRDINHDVKFLGAANTLEGGKTICQKNHEGHGHKDQLVWFQHIQAEHPEFWTDASGDVGSWAVYEVQGVPYKDLDS